MSSGNARPEINLEEFERRLRAASAPQAEVEDPLSELTRLVNSLAAERPRAAKVVEFAPVRMPKAESLAPLSPVEPEPAPEEVVDAPLLGGGRAEAAEDAAFAELRPAFAEAAEGEGAESEAAPAVAAPQEEPPARASSWYLKVAGLTALAALMAGGAVVMKFGVPGRPSAPPVILASTAPVKVAPPSESTVQSPGDTGALLLKDSTSATPVNVVSHEEQPVDLKSLTPAPQPNASAAASLVSPAPSTEIVAPSSGLTGSPAAPPPSLAVGASRVKTVSVRPDGTLIAADTAPLVAEAPAPAPPPVAKKPDAATVQAATPTLDLPAKPPAKSSARVAIAKTDTTVPTDAASVPMQLDSAAKPAVKPAKPPTKLAPPPKATEAPPVKAADAAPAAAEPVIQDAPTAPVASGGAWAVQLAAPRSESEAHGAITRLNNKYASELGGAALGVHKADVRGETIYRVRATGYSKAEATALCEKLKASGADCFVAKN